MIRNDRQLSIALEKQKSMLQSASTAEPNDAAIYRDLADDLQQAIDEYTAIREGRVNLFAVESVDDLAAAVVKARIARRWTQRQLADLLGVTEQMVQKDEARGYEKAGVSRLAEVVDVLGYQLVGELRPMHLPADQWRGPSGIVVGVPTGNWISERPPAEFKITPVSGKLGFTATWFPTLATTWNFWVGSEVIQAGPIFELENSNWSQSLVGSLSSEA